MRRRKIERICGSQVPVELLERTRIEGHFDSGLRPNSVVKSAVRTYVKKFFELCGEQDFLAVGALEKGSASGRLGRRLCSTDEIMSDLSNHPLNGLKGLSNAVDCGSSEWQQGFFHAHHGELPG